MLLAPAQGLSGGVRAEDAAHVLGKQTQRECRPRPAESGEVAADGLAGDRGVGVRGGEEAGEGDGENGPPAAGNVQHSTFNIQHSSEEKEIFVAR